MEPSTKETGGGLQLPRPIMEQPVSAGGLPEVAPAAPEKASPVGQQAPAAQPAAPIAMPPVMLPLPPASPLTVPQDDVAVTTQAASSAIVDDGDLIEKEWVDKAKQIVERNRDDPYKQSEELTVFRADYMKKRYDKSIKLN